MTLHPRDWSSIPETTAQVARKSFPKGNVYMKIGIDIIGRVPGDSSWQAQAQLGFDASCFTVDWHNHRAICPQGRTSQSWHFRTDNYDNPVIQSDELRVIFNS
ncbi:hypothetical protein [Nostoc sp.]